MLAELLHVAEDILPHDDGVVDQQADRQAQAEKGDDVDRESPSAAMTAYVPMMHTGSPAMVIERVSEVAEGQEHNEPRQDGALDKALEDVVARTP